jgi:hypothetical protein
MPQEQTNTAPDIGKLKAEHDDIYRINVGDDSFIVRPPTRTEYRRFITAASNDKKRAIALEDLCADCVLHPEPEQFRQLTDRKPGIPATIGNKLLEIAGVVEEAEAKKL